MGIVTVDRSKLPQRSAGQTSIPAEDQAAILSVLQSGGTASNGELYDNAKIAAKRAGPYRRFVKRMLKNGTLQGQAHFVTFPAGKADKEGNLTQVQWALYLGEEAEAAEAADAAAAE